jgi:hypothetical protein
MAEEKEKAIEKDQETIKPAGAKKDELSDEDLKKAAGGGVNVAGVHTIEGIE